MPSNTQPTVGVVGVPEVAQALSTLGFRVITGENFRAAATAIAAELRANPIKVIAEAIDEIGFTPWVLSLRQKSSGVILLPTGASVDLSGISEGVEILALPATVNDILPRLGFAAALHSAGDVRVEPKVVELEQFPSLLVPLATPVVAPTPAPVQEPAPVVVVPEPVAVTPAPVPVAPPAPPADFDAVFDVSNDVPPAPVAVPQPVQVPPPAPVEYVAPTPEPRAYAPEPVVVAPRPVVEPTPAPVYIPEPTPAPVYIPEPTPVPAYVPEVRPVAPPAPAPAPAPEPVYTPAPQREPEYRPESEREQEPVDDMFRRGTEATQGTRRAGRVSQAETIVSFAPKGGVFKTTAALLLAETAGRAGIRAVVIDGNRGQGSGVRTSLRLRADVPTILDAIDGPPSAALLSPDDINAMRPAALDTIHFGVILAPPRDQASPDLASGAVYARVFDWARSEFDLIIVDTQEVEGHKTDIFNDFVIPAMRAGAWGMGIVNYDFTTAENMVWAYREFAAAGVTPARQLLVASNWPDFTDEDREQLVRRYGQSASFTGVLATDQNVADQKSLGNVLVSSPAVEPVTRAVLYRVTGREEFAPPRDEPKKGRGLFGLFGGRK